MSLLNRLLISITVVVLAVLLGTLALSTQSARTYLGDQLRVQGENAATTLALLLSQAGADDRASRELLISAMFDSGQFDSIVFEHVDGTEVIRRKLAGPATSGEVPDWFIDFIALPEHRATRTISQGWRQLGNVSVQVRADNVRLALWRTTLHTLAFVLAAGVLWALFAVFLVRWLKRALQQEVERRLEQAGETDHLPGGAEPSRIAEFAGVGSLVASFREKVAANEQELASRIESLELALNQDDVTGLPNRRYFLNELRRAIDDGSEGGEPGRPGHILLMRMRDLARLGRTASRQDVDDWLRMLADALRSELALTDPDDALIARLNGSDFAVLMPGRGGPEASRLAANLRRLALSILPPGAGSAPFRWAYVLADYRPGSRMSSLLSRLDYRVMRAENAGQDDIEYCSLNDTTDPDARGGDDWRALLINALESGRVGIQVRERVFSGSRDTVHMHEATLQIDAGEDDIAPMSGYLFMPPAARLGLSGSFDLRALDLGLSWVGTHPGELVIRVSAASVIDPSFRAAVQARLDGERAAGRSVDCICLEMDAQCWVSYPQDIRQFCQVVTRHGARVGMRRLGQRPDALMHLDLAPISYARLGGEFFEQVTKSVGARHFLRSVLESAQELGIRIYGEDVIDAGLRAHIKDVGAYVA
ncbi:MAG: LapD/MoxY N-terminal periplasmic domain-containing protein [Burkholderiaceae bacterium]